ncbi:D-alanine--D-alanine ligase [Pseudoxanthomonas taiwanensis]|jgi:D-alanine--D-alanine ligase|uniref:D-alanine--D-alanine ligase n=1 Tax=Pseudoxanthomonas taiwanensis TaxID=176598 RepID=A0A921P209_9GAMM|nr:D-alanine--D-alanine ligase [Pseudoxanthomonas taiwanensis]KAF1690038.1 D-alanine--D-alanine ligase [Pseudoxanthomonas taiwanensis]MBO2467274.1 D-alanine--D-alanine ligase [Xanthomonadaceae bacterium]
MSSPVLPPPRHADPAVFGRVAVLMGGTSSEREVSLDSGRNVLEALRARGIDAHPVDGIPALVAALAEKRFDRVFNILHGGDGENGVVQGLLQALGVPYTGPGVLGSALTMDKIRTKLLWIAAGLPTARFVRIPPGGDLAAAVRELGLPVFVKPSCEGSSVGVFPIRGEADLAPALEFAAGYGGELLAEQMLTGGEYTVGILGEVALPSIRIIPASGWYDYHAKYIAEDTRYLCPGLEGAEEEEIRALALAGFQAAGCSGWGRVDVMRHADGRFMLMEVNTAPGMTSHSLVPKAAAQLGVGFEELCWRILEQTLEGGAVA